MHESLISAIPIDLTDAEQDQLASVMAGYESGHGVREMAITDTPLALERVVSSDATDTWRRFHGALPPRTPFQFRPLPEMVALMVSAARLAFPDAEDYVDAAEQWSEASVRVMMETSTILKPLVIACDERFERFVKVNNEASGHWLNFGENQIVELTGRSARIAHDGEYASFAQLSHVGFYRGMMDRFGLEGEVELEVHDERDFDLVLRW